MIMDLELSKIIVSLQAEEKHRRRQALEEIMRNISQEETDQCSRIDELIGIWESVHKFIVRILNDNVETCRDLSVEILKIFLEALPPADKHIIYVIPIMSRRLGAQEQIEPSEEVRLKCVSLLRTIIHKYKDLLAPYVQDVTAILARTVTDNYPDVKKESCRCISDYAKTLPRHFYTQSECLIKPILSNFTHQHYRVRLAAVKAIGDAIQYGNSKSMEEVTTPLAQRLFDQSGLVREAVVEVSGHWLVELPDRYSWWYRLLPLIMTGLNDELEEIRAKSTDMWDAAGKLYLQENENDEKLKDKMDFLADDPEHYPPNISRPNLGCRTIAQQNLHKLINGINVELGDWLPDIRLRSAQLLCVMILNVEEDVTQHLERLLPSIYRTCNDEDKRVVSCIETAARYLGYFIDPKIYCQLILPTLDESPTAGHLRAFAAIIGGSKRQALALELEKISGFLQQPYICRSKKDNYQRQILSCCNSLLAVCREDCAAVTRALFTVIFTTYAMAVESPAREEADRLLEVLVNMNSLSNVEDLFCDHIKFLLTSIRDDCASWTVHNAESQIFCACLRRAGIAAARDMDLVLPILKKTMGKDADPELKLQHFILLSEFFAEHRNSQRHIDYLHEYISTIIEDLIVPGLIWTAGRAAEAIRTAAVCCLCAILQSEMANLGEKGTTEEESASLEKAEKCRMSITTEQFLAIFDLAVPVIVSLADDKAKKTRLYSMRAICSLMMIGGRLACLNDEHIHRTYPAILKRLDDGCDEIRYAAVEALVEIWSTASKNYDTVVSRSHIDVLYTTMIIHLDDPESHFQEIMLDALKRVAAVHPELLRQKLQSSRLNFRNQTGVDALLQHCQDIMKAD